MPHGHENREEAEVRRIGPVDVLVCKHQTAIDSILAAIDRHDAAIFGFCNAHTVNLARAMPEFSQSLKKAVLYNDGIGIDLASRMLYGQPFPANLNGTDFTPLLLSYLPRETKLFLLGSPPGTAEAAGRALEEHFTNVRIVGAHHGFFPDADSASVIAAIRASGAELVLLGMGHPRQELWAARHNGQLNAVLLCVGAFLDFAANRVSRAPHFVRALRMEWLYRLLIEPRRMARRYLVGNVRFIAATVRQKLAVGDSPCA